MIFDRENEKKVMEKALKTIDEVFLKDGKRFIAGNEISIADISAICEINQLRLVNYDLTKYTKLQNWIERCMEFPELKSTHEVFEKVVKKLVKPKLWPVSDYEFENSGLTFSKL